MESLKIKYSDYKKLPKHQPENTEDKLQNVDVLINLLNNLQEHVHNPLKEGLLLINLIEAYENQSDKLSLIIEIKNLIKSGLNNCFAILKQGFNISKQTSIKHKIIGKILNEWNGKLFTDIAILVQKIFTEKQLKPSSKEAVLCINEIYNYSVALSNNTLDPHFAEWFVERFLNGSGQY